MPAPESYGGILALACAIVAVARRNRPIGGWLFYFFCQVALGLALIAAGSNWKNYLPAQWIDPGRYLLFAISSFSRTVLLAAIAAICFVAIETRAWRWIVALQYALGTYAFLTILKLPVDYYCVPAAAARDTLSLAFPVVWMVYFAASQRVRRVFLVN
ncbi:MAG TPA: hypothetical protein VMB03_24785 [Bryobacteraceae bacterium]|nr:hypothetical protein [Bryobacteraceae bacterium]